MEHPAMTVPVTVPEMVETMTGNERRRWARAGYPGGRNERDHDVRLIGPFMAGDVNRRIMRKRAKPGPPNQGRKGK